MMNEEEYAKALEMNPDLPRHPDYLTANKPSSRDFLIENSN